MAYQIISKIFRQNDAEVTASEAHGLATGMLCIDNKIEAVNWLTELFPEEISLIDEDKTVLVSLFEQTRQLLNGEDDSFSYDLFLPSDDNPLSEQLEAISTWCEGFLFGIGYSRSSSDWPGETGEIMKDIVEFTKLDTNIDEDLDEDEIDELQNSLMEIQEYIKVSVLMIRDQLNVENNGQVH